MSFVQALSSMTANRRTIRLFAMLAVAVTIAGCAGGKSQRPKAPPPPSEALINAPHEDVFEVVEETLIKFGFTPERTSHDVVSGTVTNISASKFANCEQVKIYDPFTDNGSTRSRRVSAQNSSSTVEVVIQPTPEGTSLTVRTRNAGEYVNSYVNQAFQRDCGSSGVIERAVIQAANDAARP